MTEARRNWKIWLVSAAGIGISVWLANGIVARGQATQTPNADRKPIVIERARM